MQLIKNPSLRNLRTLYEGCCTATRITRDPPEAYRNFYDLNNTTKQRFIINLGLGNNAYMYVCILYNHDDKKCYVPVIILKLLLLL